MPDDGGFPPPRPPRPQPSFSVGGRSLPEKYRLRPALFGCVLEEMVEYRDGRKRWERARWPVEISTT